MLYSDGPVEFYIYNDYCIWINWATIVELLRLMVGLQEYF